MSRTRLYLSLAGAFALAACTSDRVDPVRPLEAGPALRSVSAGSPATGRYIVSASKSFPSDFAAKVAALGGKVELQHAGVGLAVVSGVKPANAAKLGTISGVDEVEADAMFSIDVPMAVVHADASSVGTHSQLDPTTAARYPWQWNMRLIHADAAWAAGKLGSPAVTVAILDTGIDYDAPDLNGLVDLSRSTSFVPSDDSISTAYFPSRNRISDYNGHGTNVATQVSSKAFALAGVTSKTTLIGVKVLAQSGSGSFSGVLSGVLWAADHNADIANMSLGGSFAKKGNRQFVKLINKVFDYAYKQGMTIVVSAGNDSEDLDHNGNVYSTYCDAPHVICVSAVGPATAHENPDAIAYYTNYGRKAITVAAPGGNADAANEFTVSEWPWGPDIASWVWSYCSKTLIDSFSPAGVPVTPCAAGNLLTGFIGTSQASPHVAGLAALIIAETGKGKPNQVKRVIVKSADDLGAQGKDPFYGKGRINVAAAVGL